MEQAIENSPSHAPNLADAAEGLRRNALRPLRPTRLQCINCGALAAGTLHCALGRPRAGWAKLPSSCAAPVPELGPAPVAAKYPGDLLRLATWSAAGAREVGICTTLPRGGASDLGYQSMTYHAAPWSSSPLTSTHPCFLHRHRLSS